MKQTVLLALVLLLAACDNTPPASKEPSTSPGMGMGRQEGMMARHSAPIPDEYAGLSNPVTADEASLQRGAQVYTTHCAACHGDGGMGDGPAGAGLDPAPAPIAHTSQMMGDSYLFWRIREGGAMEPFNSAMPTWKGTLDEQARWDVINYVRALGSGEVTPRPGTGGATFDPGAEATREAEILDTAVAQGVLTRSEAEVFAEVHAAIETRRTEGIEGMSEMQAALLDELVQAETITQEQADAFTDIHSRLLDAGLME
jgi:mono/diheme cytochrome c family protein